MKLPNKHWLLFQVLMVIPQPTRVRRARVIPLKSVQNVGDKQAEVWQVCQTWEAENKTCWKRRWLWELRELWCNTHQELGEFNMKREALGQWPKIIIMAQIKISNLNNIYSKQSFRKNIQINYWNHTNTWCHVQNEFGMSFSRDSEIRSYKCILDLPKSRTF